MSSGVRRAVIALAGVAVIVVAFLVLDGGEQQRQHHQQHPSSDKTTPTVHVVDAKPQGGVQKLELQARAGTVKFDVVSDTADEIHVHGYDFHKDVAKGGTVTFDFPAKIDGRLRGRARGHGRADRPARGRRRETPAWRGAARRAGASPRAGAPGAPRPPTGSSASRTCRSRAGCSRGRRRSCSSSRSSALAVLWPRPRLQRRAASAGRAARAAWLEVAVRRDRHRGLRRRRLRRVRRHAGGARRTCADRGLRHLLGRRSRSLSVLFGDVFRAVQPVAGGRARDAAWACGRAPRRRGARRRCAYPAWLGRWPAVAGHPRASPGSSSSTPTRTTRRQLGDAGARLRGRAARRRWRSTAIEPWSATRRRVRRLLRPLRAAVAAALARRGALYAAPAAVRRAAARRRSPGTVALLCAMIGTTTLRRLLARAALDRAGGRARTCTDFFVEPRLRRRDRARGGLHRRAAGHASCVIGGFFRLGVRGMRTVGRGHTAARARARVRAHADPDRASPTSSRTTSRCSSTRARRWRYLVSDPLGDGSNLFGTATSTDRLHLVGAERRSGTCRSRRSSPGTSAGLIARPRPRARRLSPTPRDAIALAVLDARRHGRLHQPRPLAAVGGGAMTRRPRPRRPLVPRAALPGARAHRGRRALDLRSAASAGATAAAGGDGRARPRPARRSSLRMSCARSRSMSCVDREADALAPAACRSAARRRSARSRCPAGWMP